MNNELLKSMFIPSEFRIESKIWEEDTNKLKSVYGVTGCIVIRHANLYDCLCLKFKPRGK